MYKVEFRTDAVGRVQWFVVKDSGRILYSCLPRSFETEQSAWEHAEWAIGVAVKLVYEHPDRGFELSTERRKFA